MGVSVSGSDLTFATVRRLAVAIVAIFGTLFYLYGPAASPTLHDAAIRECNDHAEGNWRSYRLTWHVSVYPHWTCGDASRPARAEIDLGWWTDPRRA
jgi:hypothetical protein